MVFVWIGGVGSGHVEAWDVASEGDVGADDADGALEAFCVIAGVYVVEGGERVSDGVFGGLGLLDECLSLEHEFGDGHDVLAFGEGVTCDA